MDEVLLRRLVGVVTLAIAAFLLSWLLPRPGLDRLRGEGERVVTVDLTRPDARPQEIPMPSAAEEPPVEAPPPVAEPEPSSPSPSPPVPAQAAVESPKPAATPPVSKPTEPADKAPTPEPAKVVAQAPKPEAPPKPAEPKPAEPKPPEPKPSKPAIETPAAGGTGQVMVQAGAFSFLDKAEGVRERAGALGQRCVISPAETAKGTLYRLRCGPYADRAQAQAAVNKLTGSGIAAQVVGGGR